MEKDYVFQSPTIRFLKIVAIVFQAGGFCIALFLFADLASRAGSNPSDLTGIVGCIFISGIGVVVWLLCDIAQSLRWSASQLLRNGK